MVKKNVIILLFIGILSSISAEEGMWLPTLIEKQIIDDIHAEGLQLSASDIYNVNKACLKDAVMLFSNGCTAEFISDKGLILTNHHCSDDFIQNLSTLENNYFKDGYWSQNTDQDLAVDGLSVNVLDYIEDVTPLILLGVDSSLTEQQRSTIIRFNSNKLQDSLAQNRTFEVSIKPIYKGKQYLAIVSTEYNDIRLVGTPPSIIADFGGDTDNWDWPRHGADFCLFRVYANQDNKPAFYNENNVPFSPKKSLTISLKGVQKDDFTMVLGYPASTDLYATSYKLKMLKEDIYPARIVLRSIKLEVLKNSIALSDDLRLKYEAKANSIANSWKRWQGEIIGLNRFHVIDQKTQQEKMLQKWLTENDAFADNYAHLFDDFKTCYEELTALSVPDKYITELIGKNGMETVRFATIFPSLKQMSDSAAKQNLSYYAPRIQKHFKNFDKTTDKQLTLGLLKHYLENIPHKYVPEDLKGIKLSEPQQLEKYINQLFEQTHFADSTSLNTLIDKSAKNIEKSLGNDPATRLNKQFSGIQENTLRPTIKLLNEKLDSLNRKYMDVILSYNNATLLPVDANSTMRVSYGKVAGYTPKDGVNYLCSTTLNGILEKGNLGVNDYQVHPKLHKLCTLKDFGRYGEEGSMPVCFLASNHTTGGNSGSPVLNGNGELIGVNFDRAWDGVVSDLFYTPEICRNISVDIRYVLFIIDKFAGAKYLLNEMNIVD